MSDRGDQQATGEPEEPGDESDDGEGNSEFVEMDPQRRYGRYVEVLGKGAFKTVYRAFDEVDGIEVAWNQVKVQDIIQSPEDLERLYSEVHLLKTLKHKNIIKFYSSWVDTKTKNVNFITEKFTSGTLREYRKEHKHCHIKAVKNWARQILRGLLYLHSHDPPIIHRDLKCDNIFVNGNQGEVKIGDLGLAAILQQAHAARSVIGTPEFMAPELYEEEYNELVDIYSFGMCLLEMVTFEYPYSECSNAAQIYKKVTSGKKPAALDKVKDPAFRAFVEKCLAPASQRLPARELLMDPFLNDEEVPNDHHHHFHPPHNPSHMSHHSHHSMPRTDSKSDDIESLPGPSSSMEHLSRPPSFIEGHGGRRDYLGVLVNGGSLERVNVTTSADELGGSSSPGSGQSSSTSGIEEALALLGNSGKGRGEWEGEGHGEGFEEEEGSRESGSERGEEFEGEDEEEKQRRRVERLSSSRDFKVKGKKTENDQRIFLRLRIVDPEGHVRNIHFPFDVSIDTAFSVASEMVAELDLTDQDVSNIADMMDVEICALVPDWRPGVSLEEATSRASGASSSESESSGDPGRISEEEGLDEEEKAEEKAVAQAEKSSREAAGEAGGKEGKEEAKSVVDEEEIDLDEEDEEEQEERNQGTVSSVEGLELQVPKSPYQSEGRPIPSRPLYQGSSSAGGGVAPLSSPSNISIGASSPPAIFLERGISHGRFWEGSMSEVEKVPFFSSDEAEEYAKSQQKALPDDEDFGDDESERRKTPGQRSGSVLNPGKRQPSNLREGGKAADRKEVGREDQEGRKSAEEQEEEEEEGSEGSRRTEAGGGYEDDVSDSDGEVTRESDESDSEREEWFLVNEIVKLEKLERKYKRMLMELRVRKQWKEKDADKPLQKMYRNAPSSASSFAYRQKSKDMDLERSRARGEKGGRGEEDRGSKMYLKEPQNSQNGFHGVLEWWNSRRRRGEFEPTLVASRNSRKEDSYPRGGRYLQKENSRSSRDHERRRQRSISPLPFLPSTARGSVKELNGYGNSYSNVSSSALKFHSILPTLQHTTSLKNEVGALKKVMFRSNSGADLKEREQSARRKARGLLELEDNMARQSSSTLGRETPSKGKNERSSRSHERNSYRKSSSSEHGAFERIASSSRLQQRKNGTGSSESSASSQGSSFGDSRDLRDFGGEADSRRGSIGSRVSRDFAESKGQNGRYLEEQGGAAVGGEEFVMRKNVSGVRISERSGSDVVFHRAKDEQLGRSKIDSALEKMPIKGLENLLDGRN